MKRLLMVVKIMIAVFIWAAAPVLLGGLWAQGSGETNGGPVRTYLMGAVSEWALFFLLAKWAVISKKSLQELCEVWLIFLVILVLAGAACGIKRHAFAWRRPRLCVIVCLFVLIGISILYGGVNQDEDTIEEAWTMYATDTLYEYDAVTGRGTDEMFTFEVRWLEKQASAPIGAYYAANSFVCRWNPAKFIRLVLPVFLLPFYFGVYEAWGFCLFGEARGKRIAFQVIVWLLYGLALVSQQNSVFGIFTNCWNGETLFFTGLAPLAVLLVLEETDRTRRITQYIVCALAGQLLYTDGCFAMTFLWGIALLTAEIKRWKIEN